MTRPVRKRRFDMGVKMEITNLMLLNKFRKCAHIQYHRKRRFRGQGRILILLQEKGRVSQKELTGILERRAATLSEQLENMEKSGLIRREVSASDRRNLDILLTPVGEQAAVEARQERERMADELFGILTREEKERLYPLLEKLAEAWAADDAE